jgi:hypothetical protein
MRAVVVLGGYGRVGRLCVHELASRTRAPLVVAGRNLQRAESLALSLGDRARAIYANAHDARTLARACEGASVLVACCGGDSLVAIQTALELRLGFVGLSPAPLDARTRAHLADLAWRAQVPLVLWAGALPGLPGVLAEALVRRLPEIRRLRVASTGAWTETETARRDVAATRRDDEAGSVRARWLPELWRFADPIGTRAVVPGSSPDLDGFAETHCVDELVYLEPPRGVLGRGLGRLIARTPEQGFAVSARADEATLELHALNALVPAAALAGVLAAAMLEGRIPAGLSAPRDALNPSLVLAELEKRGVRVSGASR